MFFSGEGTKANPEITLQDEADIMMTYLEFHGKPQVSRRWKAIAKARRRGRKKKRRTNDSD